MLFRNIISRIIVSSALLASSFVNECLANKIVFFKQNQEWNSYLIVADDGNNVPRMCTVTNYYNTIVNLCLDYTNNSYIPFLHIEKTGARKNDPDTRNYTIKVQGRIDSKPKFYSDGNIYDKDGGRFIYLGSGFGTRFIDEAIDGDFFRIKLDMDDDEIPVIKFSLAGFTFAYKRIINTLIKHSKHDENYFQ